MKLFIIGNGFDLAHNLPTSYCCFKNWLQARVSYYQEYKYFYVPDIPETIMDKDGGTVPSNNAETEAFLFHVLDSCEKMGPDWSNFENALYDIDLKHPFEEDTYFAKDNARDKDGVINPFWEGDAYRESAEKLQVNIEYLNSLLYEWISQISINTKPIENFQKLIEKDDIFLSFNYTETLEKVYGVENDRICHIHGRRYTGDKLIFGHGRNEIKDFSDIPEEASTTMEKIISNLRKPTEEIIKSLEDFLIKKISKKVDSVYSYGFSYGDVDLPYIEQICQLIGKNIPWYLPKYDKDKNIERIRKIQICENNRPYYEFSV